MIPRRAARCGTLALALCWACGASDSGPRAECDFVTSVSLSPKIGTVGIVEWSSSLASLARARIEFGLDTRYGMTAPVPLAAPQHRTLLLGMKPSRAYHFHIVAESAEARCTSPDYVVTSGPAANGVPAVGISDHGGANAGGFVLSSFLTTGPAFVLDADGEYVWSYGSGEMGRAAFTHDGNYLWYSAVDVAGQNPSMKRVSLDGLEETDFTAEFGLIHHDFTLLPDDTIAFLQHDGDGDRVMERAPDGSMRPVLELGAVLGTERTHANSLRYFALDDTYTVSDLGTSSFTKFTRAGDVLWILGGPKSAFTGDGADWQYQHGHELLAPDRLLFFNNGAPTADSSAIEVELDFDAMTATQVWRYEPGEHVVIYGDVARLPNENTLVTFSTLGLVHEVAPDGTLVRELAWALGGALGYVTPFASFYPPD